MNRLIVISIVVLGPVVIGLVAPAPALGGDKYFCADADNAWSGDNWREFEPGQDCTNGTPTDPPTADDRAIIVSGKTCNVDVTTAVADSVNVESTGTLNIQGAKKLTLDGDDNDSTIAGDLYLQGANSELAVIDNSQTIDGAGKIVGQDDAAKITVALFKNLTSETTIEGKLEITGLGDFFNHGIVHANVAGTLEISTEKFEDDTTAEWKVTGSALATLLINPTSTTPPRLDGDFRIEDNATLEVGSVGFVTWGSLYWKGGAIKVTAGIADFGLAN